MELNNNVLIVTNYFAGLDTISFYNIMYNLDKYIKNVVVYKFEELDFNRNTFKNKIMKAIMNLVEIHKINIIWFLFSWGHLGNYGVNGGNIIQHLDINIFKQKNIKIFLSTADFFRLYENFTNYINNISYDNFYIIESVGYSIFTNTTGININKNNFLNYILFADTNFLKLEFNPNPVNKILLSGAIFKDHYPERSKFLIFYSKNKDKCTLLNRNNDLDYAYELNKYLCCVSTSVSKRKHEISTGCVLNKTFEICAVGSLLLAHETMIYELQRLGFNDMINCIIYNENNINEKVNFILNINNRKFIDTLRLNGKKLIEDKYSKKNFIKNISELLNNDIINDINTDINNNKNIPIIIHKIFNNFINENNNINCMLWNDNNAINELFINYDAYHAIYNIEINVDNKIALLKYLILYKYGGYYIGENNINKIDIFNKFDFHYDHKFNILGCSKYNLTMKKIIDKIEGYILENGKIKKAKYMRLIASNDTSKIFNISNLIKKIN